MSTALTPAAAAEAAESDTYLPERRRNGIGQVAKPTDDLTTSNFRGRLLRRRLNPITFIRGREIVDHMATNARPLRVDLADPLRD